MVELTKKLCKDTSVLDKVKKIKDSKIELQKSVQECANTL
jgi:hypothetical protein